jgi:hypothetical protein
MSISSDYNTSIGPQPQIEDKQAAANVTEVLTALDENPETNFDPVCIFCRIVYLNLDLMKFSSVKLKTDVFTHKYCFDQYADAYLMIDDDNPFISNGEVNLEEYPYPQVELDSNLENTEVYSNNDLLKYIRKFARIADLKKFPINVRRFAKKASERARDILNKRTKSPSSQIKSKDNTLCYSNYCYTSAIPSSCRKEAKISNDHADSARLIYKKSPNVNVKSLPNEYAEFILDTKLVSYLDRIDPHEELLVYNLTPCRLVDGETFGYVQQQYGWPVIQLSGEANLLTLNVFMQILTHINFLLSHNILIGNIFTPVGLMIDYLDTAYPRPRFADLSDVIWLQPDSAGRDRLHITKALQQKHGDTIMVMKKIIKGIIRDFPKSKKKLERKTQSLSKYVKKHMDILALNPFIEFRALSFPDNVDGKNLSNIRNLIKDVDSFSSLVNIVNDYVHNQDVKK